MYPKLTIYHWEQGDKQNIDMSMQCVKKLLYEKCNLDDPITNHSFLDASQAEERKYKYLRNEGDF